MSKDDIDFNCIDSVMAYRDYLIIELYYGQLENFKNQIIRDIESLDFVINVIQNR